jgi:hypothetical protein
MKFDERRAISWLNPPCRVSRELERAYLEWGELLKWMGVLLVGSGGGIVSTILTQRTVFKSKQVEVAPAILQQVAQQLSECRQNEKRLDKLVFQLRSDLQTMWLAVELILQKCPQADAELEVAIRRMKDRQREFLNDERGEAGQP